MQKSQRTRFKQVVLNHLLQVKGGLFLAALCVLGFTLTALLAPWPLKLIFDHVLLDKPLPAYLGFLGAMLPGGKVATLLMISSGIVLITLLRGVFSYSQLYIASRIGYEMVYTLRAERIAEILDMEPAIQDDPHAIEARHLKGEIIFDKVSFGYGGSHRVLNDVSLTISPGQQTVLLGASGSGKSTIVSLILRLYDPQEGAITIDGVNIKHYQRDSLRRAIGVVPQNSVLFGTTIKENIAYGKLDATIEEIVAAARAANAHDFILELEHGYETVIGERGATLSGGQQQRIAIARAFIRDAPILILDEPMTGLDVESEAKVREALERLTVGKTCLVITHDLEAAAEADRILVLEEGRIVERGRHSAVATRSWRHRQLDDRKIGQHKS